jgi:hypothetical protein
VHTCTYIHAISTFYLGSARSRVGYVRWGIVRLRTEKMASFCA